MAYLLLVFFRILAGQLKYTLISLIQRIKKVLPTMRFSNRLQVSRLLNCAVLAALVLSVSLGQALAQNNLSNPNAGETRSTPSEKNLAPGFSRVPSGSKVVLMPIDVELFSISAGGVQEPRADWTQSAQKFMTQALIKKKESMGLQSSQMTESQADGVAELLSLHGAIASSINLHHFGPLALPTKQGKLDWSLGDGVKLAGETTGADYALFVWMRDSYASAERKAAMIGMALLGIGLSGGVQVGYASLVDLKTGQIVWFNRLIRASGDMREQEPAKLSIDLLLENFPALAATR